MSARGLRRTLGVALVALAIAAGYSSWGALYDLAVLGGGMDPARAIVFPAIVELVMVVAMLLAVLVPNPSRRARALTWAAFAAFAAVSVAGNAAHVALVDDELALGEPVAVIVNAIPSIALLVTTHLASLHVFRPGLDAHGVARSINARRTARAVEPRQGSSSSPIVGVERKAPARDALREQVERLHQEGRLSYGEIAAQTGVPKATVGRWLAKKEEAAA